MVPEGPLVEDTLKGRAVLVVAGEPSVVAALDIWAWSVVPEGPSLAVMLD